MIPRIVHQIYFKEGDPDACPPDDVAQEIERLRAANPTWDHRLYNLAAMREWISAHHGAEMLARFDAIGPGYGAAKADLFRYLLMHRLGGIYLDLKLTPVVPLDELAGAGDYLLTQWDNGPGERHEGWGLHPALGSINGGEYIQGLIVSPPASPFLAEVIAEVCGRLDRYRPSINGVGRDAVLSTTGPVAYSQAIERLRRQTPHRIVKPFTTAGVRYSGDDADKSRQRLFASNYVTNWRPLVTRPGLIGVWEYERALLSMIARQMARVANIPRRLARARRL